MGGELQNGHCSITNYNSVEKYGSCFIMILIQSIWQEWPFEIHPQIFAEKTHQNHVCNAKTATSYPTEAQENACQEFSQSHPIRKIKSFQTQKNQSHKWKGLIPIYSTSQTYAIWLISINNYPENLIKDNPLSATGQTQSCVWTR